MKRGEVWWVDFGEPTGSAPGYRRPALVLSSDRFNRSNLATVVVAPLTSNLRLANVPGTVEIERGVAGLSRPSVVNLSGLASIDRSQLIERNGVLPADLMADAEDALRLLLAL